MQNLKIVDTFVQKIEYFSLGWDFIKLKIVIIIIIIIIIIVIIIIKKIKKLSTRHIT